MEILLIRIITNFHVPSYNGLSFTDIKIKPKKFSDRCQFCKKKLSLYHIAYFMFKKCDAVMFSRI
jgi:hypothetical protein